tara:strand:- start:1214 stop:1516 length:303 start_codon:yes stop_codon:yes gene_type:complete
MSTQTIFTDLQSGDNKKLWAYAQELNTFRRKEKEVANSSTIDFNDKSAVKQYISEALLRQMDNGNAASAKELARILGVNEETQDLILEPVNFAEATWEIE